MSDNASRPSPSKNETFASWSSCSVIPWGVAVAAIARTSDYNSWAQSKNARGGRISVAVVRRQPALRLERGHAARSRRRHGLPIDEVLHITASEDPRHASLGRSRFGLQVPIV